MPTYLLEHLATFTVSPENDLVYPADGMRRLLAMEKTSGIWTQKVTTSSSLNKLHIPNHNHNLDAYASGQKDGEHHGSREQGSSREVSHPSGERAHSVHFERPQGEFRRQKRHKILFPPKILLTE